MNSARTIPTARVFRSGWSFTEGCTRLEFLVFDGYDLAADSEGYRYSRTDALGRLVHGRRHRHQHRAAPSRPNPAWSLEAISARCCPERKHFLRVAFVDSDMSGTACTAQYGTLGAGAEMRQIFRRGKSVKCAR
jgi:hypothetical protein